MNRIFQTPTIRICLLLSECLFAHQLFNLIKIKLFDKMPGMYKPEMQSHKIM